MVQLRMTCERFFVLPICPHARCFGHTIITSWYGFHLCIKVCMSRQDVFNYFNCRDDYASFTHTNDELDSRSAPVRWVRAGILFWPLWACWSSSWHRQTSDVDRSQQIEKGLPLMLMPPVDGLRVTSWNPRSTRVWGIMGVWNWESLGIRIKSAEPNLHNKHVPPGSTHEPCAPRICSDLEKKNQDLAKFADEILRCRAAGNSGHLGFCTGIAVVSETYRLGAFGAMICVFSAFLPLLSKGLRWIQDHVDDVYDFAVASLNSSRWCMKL